MRNALPRSFYLRDAEIVARELLGCYLVRVIGESWLVGRIVETEAYLGIVDKAAHSYGGRRTQRNEMMYALGGSCYVYFTYGMHHCVNVVTEDEGEPSAVLIRALEPVRGLEEMRQHRSGKIEASRLKERDLCSGPAKLCQALQIDLSHNGADFIESDMLGIVDSLEGFQKRRLQEEKIITRSRVGIAYAQEWAEKPLRFT